MDDLTRFALAWTGLLALAALVKIVRTRIGRLMLGAACWWSANALIALDRRLNPDE